MYRTHLQPSDSESDQVYSVIHWNVLLLTIMRDLAQLPNREEKTQFCKQNLLSCFLLSCHQATQPQRAICPWPILFFGHLNLKGFRHNNNGTCAKIITLWLRSAASGEQLPLLLNGNFHWECKWCLALCGFVFFLSFFVNAAARILRLDVWRRRHNPFFLPVK